MLNEEDHKNETHYLHHKVTVPTNNCVHQTLHLDYNTRTVAYTSSCHLKEVTKGF